MTEHEWLTTTDARAMFEHLRGPARSWPSRWFPWSRSRSTAISRRKARMFFLAFARPAFQDAQNEELRGLIGSLLESLNREDSEPQGTTSISEIVGFGELGMLGFVSISALAPKCSDLLRELFGNPFRLVASNPAWLNWNAAAVEKHAHAIYHEDRFGEMPLLADTLEEAGCTNASVLDHCRAPHLHVRGCWVLDLLLGKQ